MCSYDDIIHLPHYSPQHHPRMSMEARAAQFAPFAALTGYDEAIQETARTTDGEIEQGNDSLEQLNRQMTYIQQHIDEAPTICVTYFCGDTKKRGGTYRKHVGTVEKIDIDAREICFSDAKKISFAKILDIKGAMFL